MDEYIERETAINAACNAVWDGGGTPSIARAINQIPAADVTPVVHAHWIKTFGAGGMLVGWKCSAPNCGVLSCWKGTYCPNCGAKMDLVFESDTGGGDGDGA